MGNYSFDGSAAYVFGEQKVFEVDDVLAVNQQSSDNPLPVWCDCFITAFYDGELTVNVQLMDSNGNMFSVPLYKLHKLLIHGDIVIKQPTAEDENNSIARVRGTMRRD